VKTPPRIGPTMLDNPNMLPNAPIYKGLLRSGIANAMIVIPPENKPAAPEPAIARPVIKILELEAMAEITEPTVQISIYFDETTRVNGFYYLRRQSVLL
jgi:hypothetical protein